MTSRLCFGDVLTMLWLGWGDLVVALVQNYWGCDCHVSPMCLGARWRCFGINNRDVKTNRCSGGWLCTTTTMVGKKSEVIDRYKMTRSADGCNVMWCSGQSAIWLAEVLVSSFDSQLA